MILKQEKQRYYHSMVGSNSRLDGIQAAILKVKFKYLTKWVEQKREKAKLYNKLFKKKISDKIIAPYKAPCNYHAYHQYTIRRGNRDKLNNYLKEKEREIDTSGYYLLFLYLQKCFKNLGYKKGDFPKAKKASGKVLNLPIHPVSKEYNLKKAEIKIGEFFCTMHTK